MGYVTPANWRRFMAKNGSGRVLSLTRAATTVVGTVTSCQLLGMKPREAMTSPLATTLAEVCIVQWSRRNSCPPEAFGVFALDAGVSAARRICEPRNEMQRNCANRGIMNVKRLPDFMWLLACFWRKLSH